MSGGSPQTTVSQNGPPQVFLDAYGRVVNRAENVAATPYEAYPGETVAGFSPDQMAAMNTVRGAQGISAPYINQAADYIDQSTGPLLNNIPTLSQNLLQGQVASSLQNLQQATGSGITDAASAGGRGIMDAASSFTPQSIAPWMSPYTESVVDATRRQFGHSNEQQRQGVVGNAISRGAWGGDRSAVAEAILAGEQQMAQAPVLAGLMDRGYQSGLGAAQNAAQLQTQGATAAGNLGFQGATNDAQQRQQAAAQLLGLFTGQQGLGFNANQAQAQLAQQAGYGMAGLGREAQSSTLTGAQALAGMGALQQEQAQRQLNVPYQQFMAAQQYPFQTTGWLSNITSGLGGAAGGTNTTTTPGPSTLSQVAGLGATALGAIGGTGGFGADGWLTNLFAKGGEIRVRPDDIEADYDWLPDADAPDLTLSIVPGADGMRVVGQRSGLGKTPNILQSTGTTSTTSGGGGGPLASILGLAGTVAGGIFGGPGGAMAGGAAGRALGSAFADGGDVPSVDMIAGTRPGSRIPHLNFGPPGQGLGSGIPQMAVGELPVLQQAMAGLGGDGGVGDYLAQTMRGASFAKPNFYVPPLPAASAVSPPVDPAAEVRSAWQAALEWDLLNDNTEGGGNADAGDGGSGSEGASESGGSGEAARGGMVRRAEGGFMPDEEDLPLLSGDGGGGEKTPGFMAAGNPWNALMYAGLGTMGGTSPNALTNIGRGAMVGLEQFGKERTSAEAIAARRANAAALERYRAQAADIAARRLANQERKTDADIARSEAQTNKLIAAVGSAGRGGGGGSASYELVPGAEGAYIFNKRTGKVERAEDVTLLKTKAEDEKTARANTRAEVQREAMALKDALGWEKLSVDQKNAATREFAAKNRVSYDEARLALEEAKEQGRNTRAENAEAGKGDRAGLRADIAREGMELRKSLAEAGHDLKAQDLAMRQFFLGKGMDLKEAGAAAKATEAAVKAETARQNAILRRAGQLQADPRNFGKDMMPQATRDVDALMGGKGDAPPAAAGPKPGYRINPAPKSAAELKTGEVYESPKGPVYWTGSQFIKVP
jgi:hypothetical protein